jgi:hypothetical protein
MTSSGDKRMATDGELAHYGIPRRSGRYPWGSGDQPMQSGRDLSGMVKALREQGHSDPKIAEMLGYRNTTELRARMSIAKYEKRQADAARALKLQEKGLGASAIGREMGIGESSVRQLLDPANADKRNVLVATSDFLKEQVADGGYLDIGKGTEAWRGISPNKLKTAVELLKDEGYVVHKVQVPQQFGKGKTTILTLCPPGTTYGQVKQNMDKIKTAAGYTEDGGRTFPKIEPPVNVHPSRIGVRYAEQGGGNADGVIYLRPGVPDIALGGARYAQVRIAVDGGHYLKGMAMYKDNLPAGVDILFNTGKHDTGNKLDAMKPAEGEGVPWTTQIRFDRQRHYVDAEGKTRLSALNIVNEQGDWRTWRPSLSSQILSKQSPALAKRQLDMDFQDRKADLDQILSMTNPAVKKKLLLTYGDQADTAAVHLRAKALPGQNTHVILPFERMKEGECYTTNYEDGTRVALIRHPHGGPFEIPELIVNNKFPEARRTLGRAPDAIGIHPNVAKRLSGADFDGDAVIVVPNMRRTLTTKPPLKDLIDFDPQRAYPPYHGMRTIDGGYWDAATGKVDYRGAKPKGAPKQRHMGDVSNLITDMTIKGAKPEEIARAVRHSMVVIDSEKHSLDYQRSRRDNRIDDLKIRYQGGRTAKGRLPGASTIISRAKSQVRIPERRPRPYREGGPIDPATGKKVWEDTGRMTIDRQGRPVLKRIKSTRLGEAENARDLLKPDHARIEEIYADHANALKALGNRARLESLHTGTVKYNSSANRTYATEVARLNAALNLAQRNAPLERQAQRLSRVIMQARIRDNPNMDDDAIRKARAMALDTARKRVGAKKEQIKISDKEWEAIQAGAISNHKLTEILNNADLEIVKKHATPRQAKLMTSQKLTLARARIAAGYTQAQVAQSLGVSVTTLINALE